MSDINQVPDNCLVKILSGLPIPELLHSAETCLRWQFIEEVVCEQVTSLSVRPERQFCSETYDYDSMNFLNLKENIFDLVDYEKRNIRQSSVFWRKLTEKFPNVKRFVLYDCKISAQQLNSLLRSTWSTKLTHLVIVCLIDLTLIWASINSLPSLKHLSLCTGVISSPSIPLQIEEFFFTAYNFPDDIGLALQRLDLQITNDKANCKLQRFGLEIRVDEKNELDANAVHASFERFYKQTVCFASMLTRLTFTTFPLDSAVLQFVCGHFPKLDYFDFQLEHSSLFDASIWRSLAKLTHLTDLSIRVDEDFQLPVVRPTIDTALLPQLPSVRRVRLGNCNRIHPHQYGTIESMFPKCERLSIQFYPRCFIFSDQYYNSCELMKLCYYCSNCLKLRKMIPDRRSSSMHDVYQIFVDVKHGRIQNVNIHFDDSDI